MKKWLGFIVLLAGVFYNNGYAQAPDSVRITLPEAEKLFLQNNLSLLAEKYNVDINQAFVQQARYWDNPVLNTDQNIYDGKFFRHNKDFGQIYLQLQQTIKTAGKRNKLIQLANDNVLSSQQQFNDLLRNLRYLLRSDYNSLQQQFGTLAIYEKEKESISKLVAGMDAQLQAGNISQKDNIRIKALLYSLESDAAEIQKQITDTEKEFVTLLQVRGDTLFIPDTVSGPAQPTSVTLLQLLDSARTNRPDIQLAQTNLIAQQHNLNYQKALAVPDLTVGVEYDQRSSYTPNLWGLGFSLPLPLLNKNRGNIKAAEFSIKQAAVQVTQQQNTAAQEIIAAYNKLLVAKKLQQTIPGQFMQSYNTLMQNMINSYQQRQVSLLEFIDFFDAYKEAASKQLQQEANLRNAAEEVNLNAGTTIIHY